MPTAANKTLSSTILYPVTYKKLYINYTSILKIEKEIKNKINFKINNNKNLLTPKNEKYLNDKKKKKMV